MRCAKARKLISEDLDGLLSLKKRAALHSHLESCPCCRECRDDLADIIEKAGSLPVLQPSRSSWAAISARVRRAEQAGRFPAGEKKFRPSALPLAGWRYVMTAALTLAVVGGGVIIGVKWREATAGPDEGSVNFTLAKLKEAQDYYEKAVSALSEAVRSQREGMDPRLAEAFQQNLESIDATIQVCQQIVRNDPDNITARNYLLAAYRDKVNFLEEVMGLKTPYAGAETGVTL